MGAGVAPVTAKSLRGGKGVENKRLNVTGPGENSVSRECREQLRTSCGRVEMTFRFDGQFETHGVQKIEKTFDFGISPSR